ncbi:MAG TPA: serine hydrolase [Ktedonobacteraceae bacterium]|jgi:CubicO group peptidase (beta-lactamase class C family)|nr:serine hydrolase [Ktedonobacteraceae bacterium]
MIQATELPRSTPEAQGIASSAIQAFIDAIEQSSLGVHSFLLIRNGHNVAEGWWKPYAADLPHSMFSVSKSFTSTAIGLAISEGRLSLDDSVISFFPAYVTPEIRENMGALQVRHLLSMSTGHAEDTFPAMTGSTDDEWARVFLSLPITYTPGTHFLYNTGATFMLSAILQSLTGQTLVEYLQPRLFQPLGIEAPFWQANKKGIALGGTGLHIRTVDLAKFGLLYLQRGVWNGQRLVPEAWIEEATRAHISNGDDPNSDWSQGYGFQFWRSRHNAYRGDGAFGQFCVVMPQYNAILAMTSGTTDMQGILNAVWDHLLPGMNEAALPEQAGATDALSERLAQLALPLPKSLDSAPATAERIAGRTIRLEKNEVHMHEVSFTFGEDTSTFKVRDDKGEEYSVHCGRTDWTLDSTPLWSYSAPSSPLRIAAHGGWSDEHTFVMDWQYIETPFRHIITFDFQDDRIDVSVELDLPFWTKRVERFQGHLG